MAFSDPLVCEILDAYRSVSTDHGTTPALLLQLDPPNVVWEGVAHYHEVVMRIRLDDSRRERERQQRTPHG